MRRGAATIAATEEPWGGRRFEEDVWKGACVKRGDGQGALQTTGGDWRGGLSGRAVECQRRAGGQGGGMLPGLRERWMCRVRVRGWRSTLFGGREGLLCGGGVLGVVSRGVLVGWEG